MRIVKEFLIDKITRSEETLSFADLFKSSSNSLLIRSLMCSTQQKMSVQMDDKLNAKRCYGESQRRK